MDELDDRLSVRIEALKRLPEADPAAAARLRSALRARRRSASRRLVLSPGAAAFAALALIALTSAAWIGAGLLRDRAAAPPTTPVQFVLHADGARTVALVGDFNDWDPMATPLAESGRGVWSVVVPLRPGTVRYSFLIDGSEWRADPNAAAAPADFGRPSSVALVAGPEVVP